MGATMGAEVVFSPTTIVLKADFQAETMEEEDVDSLLVNNTIKIIIM